MVVVDDMIGTGTGGGGGGVTLCCCLFSVNPEIFEICSRTSTVTGDDELDVVEEDDDDDDDDDEVDGCDDCCCGNIGGAPW